MFDQVHDDETAAANLRSVKIFIPMSGGTDAGAIRASALGRNTGLVVAVRDRRVCVTKHDGSFLRCLHISWREKNTRTCC